MATYWRISNYIDLDGEGGRVASGRWQTAGQRIVYLSESPAVAMIEMLVHMEYDVEDIPGEFTLLKITAPDALKISFLDPSGNADWRNQLEFTRKIGDAWLVACETPLARVPSVLVPYAWNYLLNPEHLDAKLMQIEGQSRERLDTRLLQRTAR